MSSRAHRNAVLGAEIKNLTDFDAAMRFEDSRFATRAGIAGYGESQIRESRWRKISFLIDVNEMGIGLIGADDCRAHAMDR